MPDELANDNEVHIHQGHCCKFGGCGGRRSSLPRKICCASRIVTEGVARRFDLTAEVSRGIQLASAGFAPVRIG